MIYTSYFAKLKALPENIVPVAICAKTPDWYTGLHYKNLAPSYEIFMNWRKNHNEEYYTSRFESEILKYLYTDTVINYLNRLTKGKDIALICYEKPTDFCHRHLVANWLNRNGIWCKEYKFT